MVEFDQISNQVLKEICMNSRETVANMARKLKSSRNSVNRRLKFLEDELKLKYVVELNERELGLIYNYIIRVKLKKSLDRNTLLNYLKQDPVAQFAAFTKGDFDLVIYTTAKTHIAYCEWEYWMRYLLKDYIASWKSAHFLASRHGFFPLHENILSAIDISSPRKEILLLLTRNSRVSLKELADKIKLSHPTTKYHITRLEKSGYIKRFTTIMQKPPKPIHLMLFMNYNFAKGFEKRNEKVRALARTESEPIAMNKCSFAASVAGTADEFAVMSFDELAEANELVKEWEEIEKEDEVKIENAIVTQVVYGSLPFRTMDIQKVYDTSWTIYDRIGAEDKKEMQIAYPEKTKIADYLNDFVNDWRRVIMPQLVAYLRDKRPYADVTNHFEGTKSKIIRHNLEKGKHVYAICFENARGIVDKFELTEKKTIKRDEDGRWKISTNPRTLAMTVLDFFVPFICSDEILLLNRKERPYGLEPQRIAKIMKHLGKKPKGDTIFFIIESPDKIEEKSKIFLNEFKRLVSGEYSKKEEVNTFTKPEGKYTGSEELSKMANELMEQYIGSG